MTSLLTFGDNNDYFTAKLSLIEDTRSQTI